MIICIDDCYAYRGKTAEEAYQKYAAASDDHSSLAPSELAWFSASEMKLSMTLVPKQKEVTEKAKVTKAAKGLKQAA